MPATIQGSHLGPDTHANRPAANAAGQPIGAFYKCTTHNLVYKTDGSTWSTYADLNGSGLTDPMTTRGDIIIRNASNVTARLAVGSAGTFLASDGTDVFWDTPAGGGGGSTLPLDAPAMHGTYGDDFTTGPLDTGKWTRRTLTDPAEYFDDPESWMTIVPYVGKDFGYLQPWTPKDETDIRIKASIYTNGNQTGFGPIIVSSAGTGLWLAFRETSRMGLFAVPTYVTPTEPSAANLSPAADSGGGAQLGEGRVVWMSLVKKGSLYYFRFSMDGITWTPEMSAHAPSAFTPDRIGVYVGAVASSIQHRFSLDWFNVVNDLNVGNNLMVTPTSGTVTATASASSIGAPGNVIDGNQAGTGWADVSSTGSIWWNAAFSANQTMNRLRLWGYNNAWGKGYVEFSSGTKIPFYADASRIMHLDFPDETTSFVKVWCQKEGLGTFPGFFEIEAYLAS